MTERLRDHRDDLEALLTLAAKALGMPAVYIEKDFWVTEVLRAASVDRAVSLPDGSIADVTFTFKGGTSLSRVFGITERFSEDVDVLAMFPGNAKPASRHKVLKDVDQAVRSHLELADDDVAVGSSTTGVKRYTTYVYPTRNSDSSLKEGVLLELGSRGGSEPSAVRSFRSLAAEHAITALGESELAWEEFAAFDVNVLAPERTLFEKLAAVHDAASRDDRDALLKYGRHFYDIYRLLENGEVIGALDALGHDGVRALVDDIEKQSVAAGFSSTPRPLGGYACSPAFTADHSCRDAIETGYEASQALIYGDVVPLAVVVDAVQQRSGLI